MPIIENISGFLQTLQIPFSTVLNIKKQKNFILKNIRVLLADAIKINDDSLDENDCKKILDYYGLAVPAILGEAFCSLRGTPMTDKERLASTCQGAMTGLGDDFFDKQRLSEQGVKKFIENPEQFIGNTASEKLFLVFYKTALNNAPVPAQMRAQIYKVFYAQLLSKQQDVPGLSYEVIKDVTLRKGAESVLYYRTAFEHPMKKGEEKMLFCIGGLMQLSNDIFDVYKDYQNGVSTIITTATTIKEFRFYYTALLILSVESAYKSGYSKNKVRKFLGLINMGVFSRCFVCLDQFEKLEKKSNHVFDIKKYNRKELICDMDTIENKLKSLKYLIKFLK